jgi:hypothetical protein
MQTMMNNDKKKSAATDPDVVAPKEVDETHDIALGYYQTESGAHSQPSIKAMNAMKQMTFEETALVTAYEKKSRDRVSRFVQILVLSNSIDTMAAEIRNTDVGKIRGKNGDVVVIFYNPKFASEYTTQTSQRFPPLRKEGPNGGHYRNLIQAVLKSRKGANDPTCGRSLHDGDCFVVGDGAKEGNVGTIMSAFCDEEGQNLDRQSKKLFVFYEEDQLAKQMSTRCSGLNLDQSENFHYISASALKSKKRKRLHFEETTTMGTVIGPCGIPSESDPSTWKMSIKDKKALYGSARLIPSGPLPPALESAEAEPKLKKLRTDATVEPVTFFGMTRELVEEIVHQVGDIGTPQHPQKDVQCVIDLTPHETMGNMCVELGIPYLAIALTPFHKEQLERRLEISAFQSYMNPKCHMHAPALCKAFGNRLDPKKDLKKDPKKQADPKKEGPEEGQEDDNKNITKNEQEDDPTKKMDNDGKKKTKVATAEGTVKGARERLLERLKGAEAGANGGEAPATEEDEKDGE